MRKFPASLPITYLCISNDRENGQAQTEGQFCFFVVARHPFCKTEGTVGKVYGYESDSNHRDFS